MEDFIPQKHMQEGTLNAQYTSTFSAVMLMESIDVCLTTSKPKIKPSFSILAGECEDISTKELTICFGMIRHGVPEEHILCTSQFRMQLLLLRLLFSYTYWKPTILTNQKLIGQGYDGAAAFAGYKTRL